MLPRFFYSRRKASRPASTGAATARPGVETLGGRCLPATLLISAGEPAVVLIASSPSVTVGDLTTPDEPAPEAGLVAPVPQPPADQDEPLAALLEDLARLSQSGELSPEPFLPDLRSAWLPAGFRDTAALDALFSA